jgi:hypothetical protein
MIRADIRYFYADGTATKAGYDMLVSLFARVEALEARLNAAAAVADATGGATVDTEARAELQAITGALS